MDKSHDPQPAPDQPTRPPQPAPSPGEAPGHGGRPRPDPTRYGDWEVDGRCIDF